ncbi:threonine-phosphate decarboxylase [Ectothiorhodospiraceae bacterium WFHF3C12]|nr:threonine-phosphate decarboxylase [Ectothiorhodospiraceae bacterium WFHF3C12]
MLEHGGDIAAAARRYGIPAAQWLDLSTGINPQPYPMSPVPESAWHRLPADGDGLADLASAHYGGPALPVPGSQAAIQALPRLRTASRVLVLSPTYAEHAQAWRRAGHTVRELDAEALEANTDEADVVVVSNPNNPDAGIIPRRRLLCWHARLASRRGWLIVDEAFADAQPEQSVADRADQPGLIVLRSLGKFFGLAGLRAGFVLAEDRLRESLAEMIGPWAVSGPARFGARGALADGAWQARTRERLARDSKRLAEVLANHGLGPAAGTALFQWVPHERAQHVAEVLAHQAILVRHFPALGALRFGLPGEETAWRRLDETLAAVRRELA